MNGLLHIGLSKRNFKTRAVILFCILSCSCNKSVLDEQATIHHENISIPTSATLNSIHFINLKTGFVAGNGGQILKTSDGANSWQNISTGTNASIRSLLFYDETKGFIGSSAGIMKTTDGGQTWIPVLVGCNVNAVTNNTFSNRIYAVGNIGKNGYIWESIDSGLNWLALKLPLSPKAPSALHAIQFISKDTAYAGGDQNGLLQTVNGGKTWSYCNPAGTENITDFHFVSFGHGYISFDTGKLFEMTANNKGNLINDGIAYPIYAIAYNNGNGVAVGKNCVYKNEEGFDPEGNIWSYMLTSEGISFTKTYYDICFASPSVAYAVGENGLLSRFMITN